MLHIKPLMFAFVLMILLNIGADLLNIFGASTLLLFVLYFPFFEECAKFIVSTRTKLNIYIFVLIYAMLEIAFSKIQFVEWYDTKRAALDMLVVMPAVVLHLSTAYVYDRMKRPDYYNFVLVLMIMFHSLFNAIGEFDLSHEHILILSFMLSILPLSVPLFALQILEDGRPQ